MDLEGALVAISMFAPPIASYFVLRRGGRKPLGAIAGAFLVWCVCVGIMVSLVEIADKGGYSTADAMWLYLPVVALVAWALWRKYSHS